MCRTPTYTAGSRAKVTIDHVHALERDDRPKLLLLEKDREGHWKITGWS